MMMTSNSRTVFKCADPTQTAPKACPAGYTPSAPPSTNSASTCSQSFSGGINHREPECPNLYIDYIEKGGVCQKLVPATCPAGSSPVAILTKGANGMPEFPQKGVCVPNTTATYTRPMPQGGSTVWPCDGNDPVSFIEGTDGELKCYRVSGTTAAASSGTGASRTTQAATNPPFATLDTNYQSQVAAYEAAVNSSIQRNDPSRLTELRTMSEGIQTTLNKMIENLTYLKKETPDLKAERDKLLEDLRRIQQDYSAMLTNTDDLETLRRIRQQENGEARRMLIIYLMAFLFASCMLLVYVIYTGRKTPTSATTAATPTMSPALT